MRRTALYRQPGLRKCHRRPDREKFNLPGALNSVELIDVSNAWLPAYVVECVSGLLAYAKAVGGTDSYLAKLVTPYLRDALAAEERVDDVRIWREWLAGRGFRDVDPRRPSPVSGLVPIWCLRSRRRQPGRMPDLVRARFRLTSDTVSRRREGDERSG